MVLKFLERRFKLPIKECRLEGEPGFKWGDEGKCYTYSPYNEGSKRNAKKKATAQGIAIGDIKISKDK